MRRALAALFALVSPGARAALVALAVIAAAAATSTVASLAGCRGPTPVSPPPPVAGPDRFPHLPHREVGCSECHDVAAVAAGVARPPGTDDHAPCDRGNCHAAEFTRVPGALCRVCHLAVDVVGARASPLRSFPADDGLRALPSRFSHRLHLDDDRMEGAVGFHVSCSDCHLAGRTVPGPTGHGPCARCHADEVDLARGPAMSACDGCHGGLQAAARTPRTLIQGDLRFDHQHHAADARGERIGCATCHTATATSMSAAQHPPPPIAACVACHDDSRRVPISKRMRMCETCHATRAQRFGLLAPRSHLPASERPADHTLAFRHDHRVEAADARRCASCHAMMSGSPDSACDECHQVMRPVDHTVLWREYDHGSEAIVDGARCATCHVADQCSACHQRRPRSHTGPPGSPGMPGAFALRDHGDLARQNPRACLTCHDPVASCSGAGCHEGM
jgi:hypothetical protein